MACLLRSDTAPRRAAAQRVSVLLLGLCALGVVMSCVSPLEPDTPRRRTVLGDTTNPVDTKPKWITTDVGFSATENQMTWDPVLDTVRADVDTSGGRTLLRFHVTAHLAPPYYPVKALYAVTVVDSLAIDNTTRDLTTDPASGSGASFQFAKGKDSLSVTPTERIVTSSPNIGVTNLVLRRSGPERIVTGVLTATFLQGTRTYFQATLRFTW